MKTQTQMNDNMTEKVRESLYDFDKKGFDRAEMNGRDIIYIYFKPEILQTTTGTNFPFLSLAIDRLLERLAKVTRHKQAVLNHLQWKKEGLELTVFLTNVI